MLIKCSECGAENLSMYIPLGREIYCGECYSHGKKARDDKLILEAAQLIQQRKLTEDTNA